MYIAYLEEDGKGIKSMNTLSKEKIEEIFSDKEFVNNLIQIEDPQQVQEVLKEKGLDLTIEEIQYVGDLVSRAINNELTDQEKKMFETYEKGDTELSDDELESVSGGIIITLSVTLFHILTVSALVSAGLIGTSALAFGAAKTHQATRGRW